MSSRYFHLFASFVLVIFAVYFQAYVIARFDTPWLQPDIITVIVVYFAIEHFLLGATFKVLLAAFSMEMMSAVPSGFFVMYYLIALAASNVISRHLVLHSHTSQFMSFTGIFLLKYVLMFFALLAQQDTVRVWAFIQLVYPSVIVTTVCVVPIFWLMSRFDNFFEFFPVRDRQLDEL